MKKNPLFLWSGLILTAIVSQVEIIIFPSSADKAWLFGLSGQRLALALIPFIGMLLGLSMVFLILWAPRQYERFAGTVKHISSNNALISGVLSFWGALFLTGILVYDRIFIVSQEYSLAEKLGPEFQVLSAYFDRFWPVLMFLTCCLALWTLYVVFFLGILIFRNYGLFWGGGAAVLVLFATIFQWVVFSAGLHVFEQIPGWYWPITQKPEITLHIGIFTIFLLFLFLILFLIKRYPRAFLLHMALITLVFVGMQYTVGTMEGRGLASLTDRFFLSYHRIYTETACNATISAREAIINYENLYSNMFLQTKPPGVLWMSFTINQIANLPGLSSLLDRLSQTTTLSKYLPSMVSAVCKRDMALVTYLFPLLASLVLWLMACFSRRLISGKDSGQIVSYSAILFILAPNIVLMSLFPDQAIYPSLFLISVIGILFTIKSKSIWASFALGAGLYGVIFLSFSMLPLLVVPIIYTACVLWQEQNFRNIWINFKKCLLPMGLGGLLSGVLFKVFLNYDIISRFERMMAIRIEGDFYIRLGAVSTGPVTLLERIRQTWEAAQLNNIELAVAIGFPIFILFIAMGVRSLCQVIQHKIDSTAAVNASLFLTYVGLNLYRVVLGEAGRLWMFWVPVMALLAVQYILPIVRRKPGLMVALVTVQLITVFLTYQFQDFIMPQLLP